MAGPPSIGFRISWIARMLRTRFDARARTVGLTRAQWRMIVTIRMEEGVRQSRLASVLEINSVTAGRILDRLESAGCIERRTDPVDRRVNCVYLTDGAAPMFAELAVLGAEEEQTALRGFSPEEKVTLEALLLRISINLQDAPQPDLIHDGAGLRETA